jgi:ABC-type lipoprotein export system ATPase subunit
MQPSLRTRRYGSGVDRPGGRVDRNVTEQQLNSHAGTGDTVELWPTGLAVDATPVRAEGISYARAGRPILQSITLRAEPGQVFGVVGPSGSGKSTLLALLAGFDRPDSGRIYVRGVELTGVPPFLGSVLQGYGLIGVLTAIENVQIPLQARKLPREQVRQQARQALAALGIDLVDRHLVDELSGGQQQRVALARAFVTGPSLLIADEPTAELDHESKQRVLGLLRRAADHGATVILATHDSDVADACDQILQLGE